MRKLIVLGFLLASCADVLDIHDPTANPDSCCLYEQAGQERVNACLDTWIKDNPDQCWELHCLGLQPYKACGPDYVGPLDDDL